MTTLTLLESRSEEQLVAEFRDLVVDERSNLARQLEVLFEMDRRKTFFHYPSLRSYLISEHGFEEWAADRRIRIARLLGRFPEIKALIKSGRLNLTLIELALGCSHREKLGDEELSDLLQAISGKSCRAAQKEIARLYPADFELPKDRVRPLSEEHSEVRFVAPQELLDKLDDIRGLLAHSRPQISMAELIDVLASDFKERYHPECKAKRAEEREKRKADKEREQKARPPKSVVESAGQASESDEKFAAPRDEVEANAQVEGAVKEDLDENKRFPSAALLHQLVRTKGYRCHHKDPVTEKLCGSTYRLELHHLQAWAKGGKTTLENLIFVCINHHRRLSYLEFGDRKKYVRKSSRR
jgi:hypothetical protein